MKENFIQLEPSMIAANWAKMGEESRRALEAGALILHLDVMDGHFVPNLTMGPDMVAAIKESVPNAILDVHLMIYSPDNYIEPFVRAGADEITFHLEATEEVEHVIDYIKKCNKKVGLAIKPETSETLLLKYLPILDKVLIMTVDPGFGGQAFQEEMLEKVFFIRQKADQMHLSLDIQVDGGIDFTSGEKSIRKGANRLVCGTHFFKQKDLKETILKYNALRKFYKSEKG